MKRGDVIWWVVIDASNRELVARYATREEARKRAEEVGTYYRGFGKDRRLASYARVAKVVLT